MICDVCKKSEVMLTLTEIVGDGVNHLRLCAECAAERGLHGPFNLPMPSKGQGKSKPLVTGSVIGLPDIAHVLQAVQNIAGDIQDERVQCSFCSSTLTEFRKTGRVGCAGCYSTFEKPLRDLLRRVHGNSRHVGDRYDGPSTEQMLSVGTREQLRQRLKRAIASEEFELAATLRDQLLELEKKSIIAGEQSS